MTLIEAGIAVAKMLIPPKTNDLEEQQRWRWVVFASLVGLMSAFSLHLALECGWLPAIYPGYALSSDTQAIQRRVDVIATLSLEHEIRAKALELCQEKNRDRRNELNDDIAKLEREYREIARTGYPIPNCDQL
jgi:hypothetical protein